LFAFAGKSGNIWFVNIVSQDFSNCKTKRTIKYWA